MARWVWRYSSVRTDQSSTTASLLVGVVMCVCAPAAVGAQERDSISEPGLVQDFRQPGMVLSGMVPCRCRCNSSPTVLSEFVFGGHTEGDYGPYVTFGLELQTRLWRLPL